MKDIRPRDGFSAHILAYMAFAKLYALPGGGTHKIHLLDTAIAHCFSESVCKGFVYHRCPPYEKWGSKKSSKMIIH